MNKSSLAFTLPPVSIIGSGNLATQLGLVLRNNGYKILEVYSRNIQNAESLTHLLGSGAATTSLNFHDSRSQVFLICVTDTALPIIASEMTIPNHASAIHCAGSIALSVLDSFTNRGVMYPLQTFSRTQRTDFSKAPLFLESSNQFTSDLLVGFCHTLGNPFIFADTSQRQVAHLAAVFANNFTNHVIGVASDILSSNGMDLKLMEPLIKETIKNAFANNPHAVQTGPAARGDKKTQELHHDLLQNTNYHNLYNCISQSIHDTLQQGIIKTDKL